jgi:hypothetical protein
MVSREHKQSKLMHESAEYLDGSCIVRHDEHHNLMPEAPANVSREEQR